MKINNVNLMLITFGELEIIYNDMKKQPEGIINQYFVKSFTLYPKKVLQVVKNIEEKKKWKYIVT